MTCVFSSSYNPFDGPNENPEAELPLTAGRYLYVYGDMDEDGFYEGLCGNMAHPADKHVWGPGDPPDSQITPTRPSSKTETAEQGSQF